MPTTHPTSKQTFSSETISTFGVHTKQNTLYETVESIQDRQGYTGDLASDVGSDRSQIKNLQNIGSHSSTTAAVASAFTMPQTVNVVVTGTSPAMTSITVSGNDLGRVVYMRFPSAVTVTSGSGLELDTAQFVGPGTLILGSDGTKWFEHGRSGSAVDLTFGPSATAVATASASGATGLASDSGHVHNLPNGLITAAMIAANVISDIKRVASDVAFAATTTLGTVTGLSVNLTAGLTYEIEARLYVTADATGGQKYALAGTATATAIVYDTVIADLADASSSAAGRATALGTATALAGNTRTAFAVAIRGTITVNAGGTLLVQAAQNSASGTTTILRGSTLRVLAVA